MNYPPRQTWPLWVSATCHRCGEFVPQGHNHTCDPERLRRCQQAQQIAEGLEAMQEYQEQSEAWSGGSK
jgi:hypothetical protein